MRFDLTDLRLFLAVIDVGSITHGASQAGLSLAAASERLRAMEEAGKVILLHRGRRGVAPTEAGEALAHHARTILHQIGQMHFDLGRHAKGMRSQVRILANTAAIAEFVPERLASWMAAHPQVDVELKERQSADVARSLAAGFAEIGILSSAALTGAPTARPFAIDRLVAICAPGHPFAKLPALWFTDLLDAHFVGLMGGALQQHIEMQASRIGATLRRRVALRSFEGICHMVGAGVGVGIVPETAARRLRSRDRIAIVWLKDDWATRRLVVGVRSEAELTPAANCLFEHLASKPGAL